MHFRYQAAFVAALLVSVPATAANLLTNGGFEDAPVGVAMVANFYAPNGMVQQYPAAAITSQYLSGWTIATPGESNLQAAPYVNYGLYPGSAYEGSQFFSLNWSPLGGVTSTPITLATCGLDAIERAKRRPRSRETPVTRTTRSP